MESRRLRIVFTTVCCVVGLSTATAVAAENVFHMIPEKALGFAVVNRLDEMDTKLQKLCQATQAQCPGLTGVLQTCIGNRQGLDTNGAFAVVLLPGEEKHDMSVGLMLVPVTDYEAFTGQSSTDSSNEHISTMKFGSRDVLVGHNGGYALIAKKNHREVLQDVLRSPKTGATLFADWETWLGDSDAAFVVMRPGVRALCKTAEAALQIGAIPLALQKIEAKLVNASEAKTRELALATQVLRVGETISRWTKDELDSYAVAINIDQDGSVHVIERERLNPHGELYGPVQAVAAPDRSLLFGLPARPIVAVQSLVTNEQLSRLAMDAALDIMAEVPILHGLDEEQIQRMANIAAAPMRHIRGVSKLVCEGPAGEPLLANVLVLITVDDADAYFAEYRKTLQAIENLANDAQESILATIDSHDIQLDGCPGLKISIQPPIRFALGNSSCIDNGLDAVVGNNERINVYVARANENTVVVSYLSEKLLIESLKVVRGLDRGLAAAADVSQTAAMLPDDALWCGYFSPKGIVNTVNRLMPLLAGETGESCRLPDFPVTPPIGFIVKSVPEGFYSHTVFPATTVQAIGQYVADLDRVVKDND